MSCSPYDKYMSAFKINTKGKAISLQAWRDIRGFRKLRFSDFKTDVTRRW
jgi:hypothetical protein